jgi:hypothetical protein
MLLISTLTDGLKYKGLVFLVQIFLPVLLTSQGITEQTLVWISSIFQIKVPQIIRSYKTKTKLRDFSPQANRSTAVWRRS